MSPVPLCDRDPPTKVTSKKGIVKVMITTRMARILSTRDRIEFHDRFGEREREREKERAGGGFEFAVSSCSQVIYHVKSRFFVR